MADQLNHQLEEQFKFFHYNFVSEHQELNLFEHFNLTSHNNISLEIAGVQTNKILKRFEAQIKIQDILLQGAIPYSLNNYFHVLNVAISEGAIAQDKGEYVLQQREAIQHEWDDGEEIISAPIDTHAAYFLNVIRRDSPMKNLGMDTPMIQIEKSTNKLRSVVSYNDDDEAMSYTTSRMRKPVSRIQSNMTVKRADAIKEKEAEMEQQVKQIPLQRNLVEDDSEIEIYRKMKQRDFDRKEEERKKQEAVRRKLNEVQKERKAYEDELMKKAFTFDTKGDIILVKHVNTEQLPKDAVNLELKYNLRKLPSSTKGVYSFEKPQKLAPMKKRESQSLQQIEELQNEEKDADKPKKKGKSANIIDFLATGKNLKLAFSGIKQVQNVIIPMGSNFDKMEPDTGVVIEEKGRTKKSQNSNSQVLGKLSRTDYSQRFSKTMFNFSVDSTSVNQNMMSMTQNSLLGADLYKQRVSQVQAMKVVEPNEQSLLKMNPVPRLNIDTSLDNNTLQLSQPLNDSLLYHTQSQSFNRDRINFKTSKTNPQSLLISPINDYKNFMIPKINQSSMQNQSMNMTSQSFLPNANQFTHSLTKTRSQLFLHKKNVPKLFDDTYGDQSLLLPPLKSKLDEVYDDIAKNNGQAPVGELNQNPSKNKKSRMPVTQIQSILKQAKSQKALAMSQTSVTFKFNETQDSSNQSQIKSMKYSQNQGGINVRSRPFIEKVTSSNKHHLPPPPLGKSTGHGIN